MTSPLWVANVSIISERFFFTFPGISKVPTWPRAVFSKIIPTMPKTSCYSYCSFIATTYLALDPPLVLVTPTLLFVAEVL